MVSEAINKRVLGERGLRESLNRLRGRLHLPSGEDPRVSLAETLDWCHSLDGLHRKQFGERLLHDMVSNSEVDGQSEGGLLFARSLFPDTLDAVVTLVVPPLVRARARPRASSADPDDESTIDYDQYQWKPIAALVLGRDRDGRDAMYRRHVENQPMLRPVEAAARFLLGLPWQSSAAHHAGGTSPVDHADGDAGSREGFFDHEARSPAP